MKESFYFLHHGQTDWNAKGLLMGQQDIPLNHTGRQQAELAGKILAGLSIATLCFSPLKRTKETAEIVAKYCPCSLNPMKNLMERKWGKWEGEMKTKEELSSADGNLPFGAETAKNFKERILNSLNQAGEFPEPVLLVSHDGVLSVICQELHLDNLPLENNQIAHFFQELGKWKMEIVS